MVVEIDIIDWGSTCKLSYNLAFLCKQYGEKERVGYKGGNPVFKVTVNRTLCKKIFKNILQYYYGDIDEIEEYIIMNCKDEDMEHLFQEMRKKYKR